MFKIKSDSRYAASLKHPDVEETIDMWFYRPMGFGLASIGEKFGWTPNFISILSIFLGIGAGVLFYPADWLLNLMGMSLLVMADICDSADGQLARMTKQYSRLGRILDGACGDIWFVCIYVSICLRLTPEWGLWIWILASVAGLSHRYQACLADYYRQFHLFLVNGKNGSELDDSRQIIDEYNQLRFFDAPLYKLFLWFYKSYTLAQESYTPRLQALRRRLMGQEGTASAVLGAAAFDQLVKGSRPLMKYCNILTFNCRAITLFVALMLGMPWLYFAVEIIVGNVLLLYLWRNQERISTSAISQLP